LIQGDPVMSLVYKSMYFELGWIIGQLAVFFV